MKDQPYEHQHGLFVSSAYGQAKKTLPSANRFKLLLSELNQLKENEIPGRASFTSLLFQENMDKGEARELYQRWTQKKAPPAYLVCASYAALMGNQEIIQEQVCRPLRYLLKVMNEETEGNKKVKELFEGMIRVLQIVKHRARVERDNYLATQREQDDPKNEKKRNEADVGKEHCLYLLLH